jgi:hypothetical protein
MSRTVVGVLAFVAGVATGLLIAKAYARQTVQSKLDSGLAAVGLGGGLVQDVADSYLVPKLV